MLNNAHLVPCKLHAKFQPGLSFNLLLIAKQLPMGVVIPEPHLYLLIMFTQVLGDHTSIFGLIGLLIDFW